MRNCLLLMSCLLFILTGCKGKRESRSLQAIPVEVMVVGEEAEAGAQNYVGTIEGSTNSMVLRNDGANPLCRGMPNLVGKLL